MKVVQDNLCILHDPPHEILSGRIVPYFESPARHLRIKAALSHRAPKASANTKPPFDFVDADPLLDIEQYVLSVHQKDYVDYVRNAYEDWAKNGGDKAAVLPECFMHTTLTHGRILDTSQLPPIAKAGMYCFDLSCPITADTYTSAIASVRVALTAAQILWTQVQEKGDSADATGLPSVFALTRPPGHHAGSSICGGYCFFNNVAIATRFLQYRTARLPSIAILDIDYHHGNGTQQIFYDDPTVLYVSLHAMQDYPCEYFSGASDERGAGPGQGFNLNIPLPKGSTGDLEYCAALQKGIENIANYNPKYLLISLGVDTFEGDPICDFKLTIESYTHIGALIASLRKPTLFVMEGGYDLNTIGWNVRAVLESFVAGSASADLSL